MKSEIISDDGEEKTCQCREDMRWNSKALECQVGFWNWLKEDFGGALDMAVEEKGILQWRMATITAITMSRRTLMSFAFL